MSIVMDGLHSLTYDHYNINSAEDLSEDKASACCFIPLGYSTLSATIMISIKYSITLMHQKTRILYTLMT